MANDANISGSHNIVIQGVNDSTIVVKIGTEVQEIRNDLAELKALLSKQQASRIQYAEKIYNIEHITEANFGMITSGGVFNAVLLRRLVNMLRELPEIKSFLQDSPADWEGSPNLVKAAQGHVERSYNGLIGEQLRRLFAIGKDTKEGIEIKVTNYMSECFKTYRLSLQLMIFILLAHLWDNQTNGAGLVIKNPIIHNFFILRRPFSLAELRKLLIELIQVYTENRLAFPLTEQDTRHLPEIAKPDSAFQVAGQELERLEMLNLNKESYGIGHCHTAEIELANVLVAFPFFAKYGLITMQKIVFEGLRHSAPSYIKDYQRLGIGFKDQASQEAKLKVKYDEKPAFSYAVSLSNNQASISLFPFIIDYGALEDNELPKILTYSCRSNPSSLCYAPISADQENEKLLSYQGIDRNKTFDKPAYNQAKKAIRTDLVIKQFEQAMNTLLGTSERFVPAIADETDNI